MSEKTVDETIEEKEAALRAALATRYEKEQKREFKQDKDSNKNKTNSILNKDSWKNVKEIETDIDEEYTSLADLQDSVKKVKKVRFKLDNEEYTQWYQWHPDNKKHQLTHIVDYYTDGSISDLIGTKVPVAKINGDYYINYPTPYNSRIAHIMYPIYQKLRLFNDPDNNNYKVATYVNESEEISPSNDLSVRLSKESSFRFGGLQSYFVLIGIILFLLTSSSFILPLVAFAFAVITYWRIEERQRFFIGFLIGIPLSIFNFLKPIYNKTISSIKQLNRIDPIE